MEYYIITPYFHSDGSWTLETVILRHGSVRVGSTIIDDESPPPAIFFAHPATKPNNNNNNSTAATTTGQLPVACCCPNSASIHIRIHTHIQLTLHFCSFHVSRSINPSHRPHALLVLHHLIRSVAANISIAAGLARSTAPKPSK